MRRLAVLAAAIAAPSLVSAATLPELNGRVQVLDTQTLEVNGTRFRLAYVEGGPGPLTQRMQSAIVARGGIATCYPFADGRYACSLPDGEDIATLAIMFGYTRAAADAPPSLKDAQKEAAAQGYGGWRQESDVAAPPVQPPVVVVYPTSPPAVAPDYAAPLPPPDDVSATAEPELPPTVDYDGLSYPLVWGGASLGYGFYDQGHYWHPHAAPIVPPAVAAGPRVIYPGSPIPRGPVSGLGPLPAVVRPFSEAPAGAGHPGIPTLAIGQYHPLPHAYVTAPVGTTTRVTTTRIVVAHGPVRVGHPARAVVR
ncbi:MAG TPA: hypothetical protein VJY39_09345 [Acidisphaera sp.]|nr:hypothetical protein [Acidisphaera sp.]